MDVVRIPLAETAKFGGREVDAATVSLLAESMAAVGLLSPIIVSRKVRNDGPTAIDTFWIIAGRHRTEAARSLKWTEIDAVIVDLDTPRAELCEIDENLIRSDLSDAQRAKAHARRAELMEGLGLVSRSGKGGDRSNGQNVHSYADQAADALGVDARTVRRDLARGKKIIPEVLDAIEGTEFDKGTVMDEVAKEPPEQQVAKFAEIKRRRLEAEDIKREAEKANRATDRTIGLTMAADFANWIMARTDLAEMPVIISWLEGTKSKDVIAALRREAA